MSAWKVIGSFSTFTEIKSFDLIGLIISGLLITVFAMRRSKLFIEEKTRIDEEDA